MSKAIIKGVIVGLLFGIATTGCFLMSRIQLVDAVIMSLHLAVFVGAFIFFIAVEDC